MRQAGTRSASGRCRRRSRPSTAAAPIADAVGGEVRGGGSTSRLGIGRSALDGADSRTRRWRFHARQCARIAPTAATHDGRNYRLEGGTTQDCAKNLVKRSSGRSALRGGPSNRTDRAQANRRTAGHRAGAAEHGHRAPDCQDAGPPAGFPYVSLARQPARAERRDARAQGSRDQARLHRLAPREERADGRDGRSAALQPGAGSRVPHRLSHQAGHLDPHRDSRSHRAGVSRRAPGADDVGRDARARTARRRKTRSSAPASARRAAAAAHGRAEERRCDADHRPRRSDPEDRVQESGERHPHRAEGKGRHHPPSPRRHPQRSHGPAEVGARRARSRA